MENVLVVGANTRPVACSLKKLGYNVFSADYYCTEDLKPCADSLKCVLSQIPYASCGRFSINFDEDYLAELATLLVDRADFIICCSGSSPQTFPSHKIKGNKNTENIENKYKLSKKLKNKFRIPETHLISGKDEIKEIITNSSDKKFILKPIRGTAGMGIRNVEEIGSKFKYKDYILQEKIIGENLSVSTLSTGKETKTILKSQQIIGKTELGQIEPYGYCGNIVPYKGEYDVASIAEEVVQYLSLVGSNGVDFIQKGDELYLLEVNPRFQGTIECAEAVLGINMAEAHIKACDGTLMEIKSPQRFAVKMIVHARERSIVGKLGGDYVYDIPHENVIIEKGEPVATVIKTGTILKDVIHSTKIIVGLIYSKLHPLVDKHC
jgi:uncharacterized protein